MGKRMPPRRIAPRQWARRSRAWSRRPDARRERSAGAAGFGSCSVPGHVLPLPDAAERRGSLQAHGRPE
eukprot:7353062-Heterocapsa_arctica.AAC.1